MTRYGAVAIDFTLGTLNLALYVGAGHHWWSLAAAVFCYGLGVWLLSL